MGLAEAHHVGKYFVAACPGCWTGCAEGIANKDDAGLSIAFADIEVHWADFDAVDFHVADQRAQARHDAEQGGLAVRGRAV